MQRFVEGEEVIFQTTFYNDRTKLAPVDPATVTFEIEKPSGTIVNVTPSLDGSRPTNVGKYIAFYVVDQYGTWNWRWATQSPIVVRQGTFEVVRDNVN